MIKLNANTIRFNLLVCLILLAPMSKYPYIALPSYNFSSYRLGLYQILAAVFVGFCLIPGLKKSKQLYLQNKTAFISLVSLLIVALIGIFSALYKARSSLLIISILFLLALVGSVWWYCRYQLPKNSYKWILKNMLIASIFYGILALIELIFTTFSTQNLAILCNGCVSDIFGFTRVNLFSAEPQFFANAMLPFFFISLGVMYYQKSKLAIFSLLITSITITLTFSRGAYIAVFVGLLAFIILLIMYKKLMLKKLFLGTVIILLGFVIGFSLLVASASYKYKNTPYITYNTTVSMLNHMTNGVVNIPQESVVVVTQNQTNNNFVSPGLIKASSNERIGAADLAINAWNDNPYTIIFGVGAGNLGPYVIKHIQSYAPNNLTVYIYYVLVLAELGIVGLLSLIILFISAVWALIKRYKTDTKSIFYLAIGSLLIAFATQYMFFGTYINAVYIWLWIGLALGLSGIKQTNKTK